MPAKKKRAATAPSKKKSAPKAAPKKAAPKKAAPKEAAAQKAASQKAAPKKAGPKKAAPKKAAPRKAAPKKAAPKKAAPKEAAPKKAAQGRAPGLGVALGAATTPSTGAELARALAPRTPPPPPDPTEELAQALAALTLDKKAEDVVILRVTELTSYADYFVLASAPSERQVQAIARHAAEEMKRAGKGSFGTEGLEQGHWVLADYGAVVLHVFLSNARQYYDLEGFWSEAPKLDVEEARGLAVLARLGAAAAALRDDEPPALAANE